MMDLPEIADFARNFAVMVRIQGPDPKGVKMRKHAFHQYNSGRTTLSASGVLIPGFTDSASRNKHTSADESEPNLHNSVLVLTVASVIEPFLSPQHRENIPKTKPLLVNGVGIDILMEMKGEEDKENGSCWLPVELLKMVDVNVSSDAVQSLVEASPGSVDHGWDIGWSLTSDVSGYQSNASSLWSKVEKPPFQSQGQITEMKSSNSSMLSESTTRLAILRASSQLFRDLPKFTTLPHSRKGNLLLAIGSPFGILSPMHFFNSISVGSIANSYPPSSSNKSLLMADIRCLPGMEGSPVFGEHAQLIGMLTRPLRQRITGAEIQLVIPWEAIESVCSVLLQVEPQLRWKSSFNNSGYMNEATENLPADIPMSTQESISSHSVLPSPVEKAMSSICLINIDDGAWASGIFLNKQGLVLTNAHLLEPWRFGKAAAGGESCQTTSELISFQSNASSSSEHEKPSGVLSQTTVPSGHRTSDFPVGDRHEASNFNWIRNLGLRSIRVRLDSTNPWLWSDAKVVYVSKGPLDVALLQLEFIPDQLVPINVDLACPSPGSQAYVIGHGLLGPRSNLLPSVYRGVISKIVDVKNNLHQKSSVHLDVQAPAMLETTAAVHAGGSGGAIVDLNGNMVALVTSNARHGGETVIPHLNFSIPCAAMEPIFKFSKDVQSLSLLDDLDRKNEHLAATWALMPSLTPMPGPSLPRVPEVQRGDSEKAAKGSRFAKFMAERADIFKSTPQLGKVENLPSKL